ncbi:MAG TPA: FG-GAP-like repeat-containing protein [Gemmataceae bacterium]|nr:FG-GAP-like repeat-containing protein [Gemmataceae bacterium]
MSWRRFGRAIARTATPDWPVYRHDVALTGVSLGRGKITTPRVLWDYYLGVPFVAIAADRPAQPTDVADLDDDGRLERFILAGQTIRVSDLNGKLLWSHTVTGRPLGGNVRVAKLFPDRRGLQIITFSSRMDTGDGQGYCFAFDNGADKGELVWTTGPLTGQHAPTLVIDDVDGDGKPEIVVAPHYRVQIFDGQTGKIKAEVPWDVGRNYGILLTRPRKDSTHKDIYIVCDFVLHADRITFREGRWVHAWGHKYVEPDRPLPRGREQYIRVGPNPVADLDGDGRDQIAYMHIDAAAGDNWHLHVRDGETGKLTADLPNVWLWSIADLDGDGRPEIVYTPTREKRPTTWCDLHIARWENNRLADRAVLKRVRPLIVNATLPATVATIADEGLQDLLRTDIDRDGRPELFVASRSTAGPFEDSIKAVALTPQGEPVTKWTFARRGHRLNLLHAGTDETGMPVVTIRDLAAGHTLTLDARAAVTKTVDTGRVPGFTTTPIVVDVDGDGRNEIVLQTAAGEITALKAPAPGGKPTVLWSVPGVAMSPAGGYVWNGPLSPQAADVDGDGFSEVVFAAADEAGRSTLVCADGRTGKPKWRTIIDGAPWGGLQAGVDTWSFGRFTRRPRGLDVYVGVHRRAKNSGEGWVLRGDTGAVMWRQAGLVAAESAMPFGSDVPAIADLNGDGVDELVQAFYVIYAAVGGDTGTPVFPPVFLPGPRCFGKWIAYSSPTVADLDGDGKPDVYLNSASYARGGYAAVRADGRPLWVEFHDNTEGSDGFGPVGDFDGDGKLEIAAPVLNGMLVCLNAADGKWKWKISTPVTGDVVAADVNGDGVLELVFAGRDGRLRAVSGKDGREVWSVAATGRPIIADIDADGLVEMLAVGGDGVLRAIGTCGAGN